MAIDDEGRGGPVTFGEIAAEQVEPVVFGGGAGGGGMFEEASDGHLGQHFFLDGVEDFGEVELAGVGWVWHSMVVYPRVLEMNVVGVRK